jgi:hypothetical protein
MEFITGAVSQKGRELGLDTPFNDAVLEIDKLINRGELKMEPENYERLRERLAQHLKA